MRQLPDSINTGKLESVSYFDGSISGICEVVTALARLDCCDEVTEVSPGIFEGALLGDAHPVLDLGEGLLDRIEVG